MIFTHKFNKCILDTNENNPLQKQPKPYFMVKKRQKK